MRSAAKYVSRLRLSLGGLALVTLFGFSGSAVRAYMFEDCIEECGPCVVWALNCDSCTEYNGGSWCEAWGEGCTEGGCDCGGDPGWYCC